MALAIQALNGKLFHKRKLYVNSNNRSPKRTPDVTERPQELLVGAWPLYSQGCSVVTFFFNLFSFGCAGSSLLHRLFCSCDKQGLVSSCSAWACHCRGFSCCVAWGLGHMWAQLLLLSSSRRQAQYLWHVGSSRTRDQTCVSCIDRLILYH